MWTCDKCEREFGKSGQPHTCQKIPVESHFKNKEKAKKLFEFLVRLIEDKIGKVRVISIPCCIHLFGKYDFLAALPKKDRLEIRFVLNRKLEDPRLKIVVPVSSKYFKNCIDITDKNEYDSKLVGFLTEAYHLKD